MMYQEYRLHYPYAMVIRESDGSIMFINRDYAPLQPNYVHVPIEIVRKIASMGDMNGSQMQGFETHWFYDDGNSPANHIGKPAEKNFIKRMRLIGSMLLEYGYSSTMYFENPGKRGDNYFIREEPKKEEVHTEPVETLDVNEMLLNEVRTYLLETVLIPTDASAITGLMRHLFRNNEALYPKVFGLTREWDDNYRQKPTVASDLQFVVKTDWENAFLDLLNEFWQEKSGARSILMPLRAAMDAGIIRKPKFREFQEIFPNHRIPKSTYNRYMNPSCQVALHPFSADESFNTMKESFEKIKK